MLIGINAVSLSREGDASAESDCLELYFLRKSLRALNAANKDTRFLLFAANPEITLGDTIPVCVVAPNNQPFYKSIRSGLPTVERAALDAGVEVLLSPLRSPSLKTGIPQALFTLDMLADGGALEADTATLKKWKRACLNAKVILCPSEYVQKTCGSSLEIGLEKIVVTRSGVDSVFEQSAPGVVEGRYALLVLNRYTLAQVRVAVEAIKRKPDLFPPVLVVLGPVWSEEPRDWGAPLVRIEQCPDSMTAALMRHADLLLYPARGDGSGIPVLQGLRSGPPIVTTKSGALFEIAGTVPFYFEADNAISLLQAMRRMQDESPEERSKRNLMGKSLVSDCNWERCGWRMLSALKRSIL